MLIEGKLPQITPELRKWLFSKIVATAANFRLLLEA